MFRSNIAVQKDGSLDVTETIEVTVENVRINHGIFRDFPLRYHIPQGSYVRVGFELIDASLDDQPVRYSREAINGGARIKLGDPDTYVSPGPHLYQIDYRADRELGRFEKFDELYWNVTGNGWIFPIDAAEVTVKLPQPVKFTQLAFYTGREGSQEQSARLLSRSPDRPPSSPRHRSGRRRDSPWRSPGPRVSWTPLARARSSVAGLPAMAHH